MIDEEHDSGDEDRRPLVETTMDVMWLFSNIGQGQGARSELRGQLLLEMVGADPATLVDDSRPPTHVVVLGARPPRYRA